MTNYIQKKRKRGDVQDRIIRVLLNYPDGRLSKYRVMILSEGSQTWVYDYINQLGKKGYLDNTKVIDIKGLFQLWKKISKKVLIKEYLVKNPMKLLNATERKYALTTYQAENLIQNYLFPSRTDIYCKNEDQNYWQEKIGKFGQVGKGNFRIIYDNDHVFFNSTIINNYTIVSTPQLIVDLLKEGGPSVEAAEMLIEKMVSAYV